MGITRQRFEVLLEKSMRLAEAGVTWSAIEAKQRALNSEADEGVEYDFNEALELLHAETFSNASV